MTLQFIRDILNTATGVLFIQGHAQRVGLPKLSDMVVLSGLLTTWENCAAFSNEDLTQLIETYQQTGR
jgi:hypothetical protein